MKKNAFTMIEIVFVIVVLGILAAIAVPKFAATRDDATVAKGRAAVASIRSGIVTERQARLIKGDSTWITAAAMDTGGLFGGVLMYPIAASTGDDGWSSSASGTYTYSVGGTGTTFTYDNTNGKFTCSGGYCSKLSE